ncbi:MAG: GMC family oxidoreductase [Thermoleophilia bacterium]|nr:GMC family oxidoreductase [Thermoleophilia bacterium]
MKWDDIVVGSGPGGATVARELAVAGRRVAVLEYGPPFTETGFRRVARAVYRDHEGYSTRTNGGVLIGRGRVVGGSSYIAMGNAVTPPPQRLAEWGIDLSSELAEAREDLRVEPMRNELLGPGTRMLNEAAAALGWEMKPTPKCIDLDRCRCCGLCMFGCPTGAKWTSVEFLDDALAHGAQLLTETEVKAVVRDNGRAVGVTAHPVGRPSALTEVLADRVILAAGALDTPRILQRSGLHEAGTHLALDAFVGTFGFTDDEGMQSEHILGSYLESALEEKDLFPAPYMYVPFYLQLYKDYKPGDGPMKVSTADQATLLLKSKRLPAKHALGMMSKIRDEMSGQVRLDGTIDKRMTVSDQAKLEEAKVLHRELLVAAGVRQETIFDGPVEAGHPCCTAGIGRVVDEHQQTEISGLYVADASVFPSPLGMPPILTIVAMSKRLSRHLLG